ncbi:MAG: hypothetical protein R3F34_09760 [Planctomycetota bacterium]
MRTSLIAFLAASVLAAPPALASSVWVVDASNGPGTDFTTIQAALAVAGEGDTLLLRTGNYAGFVTLDDFALSIIGDRGANVTIDGLVVQNLSAGKSMVVRGVRLSPLALTLQTTATFTNCAGVVHVEGTTITDAPLTPAGSVRVTSCASVTFARCTIYESAAAVNGVASLAVNGSNVAVFGCTVQGGVGQPALVGVSPATAAMSVTDGVATISASTLIGGTGGTPGSLVPCSNGGDGRGALRLDGTGLSVVEVIDSVLTGGNGGGAFPPCTPGNAGPPTEVVAGTLVNRAGVAPRFRFDSPLRTGSPWSFELDALPGSFFWIVIGVVPGPIQPFDPVLNGVLTVGAPQLLVPLVALPPSGSLDESVLPGTFVLPPGLTHLPLFFQPLTSEPTFKLVAGTPSALLLLDPSF